MKRCYDCQKEVRLELPLETKALCPNCNQPLHCCFNCRYFSPGTKLQCLKPIESPIQSQKQANSCDYFEYREIEEQKKEGAQVSAKNKLDDLFSGL